MNTQSVAISTDRINDLINVLVHCHGGGFANYIVTRDELLAALVELSTARAEKRNPGRQNSGH